MAIVRALQLGDVLCWVPALRALRFALPDAELVFISLPWAREVVARFPHYLSGFIEFPGLPGLPERRGSSAEVDAFFTRMRDERFDLIVQMQGNGTIMNEALQQCGARSLAGFALREDPCANSRLFLEYPDDVPEVVRHLRLIEWLSGVRGDARLEWPIRPEDRSEADLLLGEFAGRPYVCLHPGARYPSRRWPAERFAAVGQALFAEGYELVVTGSPEESALGDDLSRRLNVPHCLASGRTTLGGLFAIVDRARLVVTNDTGMSHVAAATQTPSVVIVTGSDARRWAPLDAARHRVVQAHVACQPCEHRICPTNHECAVELGVPTVLGAVRAQLRKHAVGPKPAVSQRNLQWTDCAC